MQLTLGQLCTASGWLAQDSGASGAHDNTLSMAEDGCNLIAARAFHVHEVAVWVLHQALKLVLAFLFCRQRV